jgi:hypothetical protein
MALSEINQQVQDEVVDLYQNFGEVIVKAIQDSLTANNKVASGKLYRSVYFRIDSGTKVITLEVNADQVLKLAGGRNPGKMPPIQEILKWIRIKGIEANGIISQTVKRKGQSVIRRKNVRDSQEKFAYAIAKNIMRNGTKSLHLLEPIIEEVAPDINKGIGDIMTQIIQGSVDDIFDKDGNALNLTYSIY